MNSVTSSFISKFNGMTEPYFFYDGEVELRYEPVEHIYYLLKDGQFIPQEGVTSVVHIIDKSNALIPWAAKVVIEKLMRTLPWAENAEGTIRAIPSMEYAEVEKLALEAKKAPKDKLEEAADVGHIAHEWIENYIKCDLGLPHESVAEYPDDEKAASCCKAALTWMEAHNVRWRCTERKIYSREHGYAGTMDGLALVDSCSDPLCCPVEFKNHLSVIDWKSSNYLYIEYLYQTAAYQKAYMEEMKEPVYDRFIIRLGKTDGSFEAWHAGPDDFVHDWAGFHLALYLYRNVKALEERVKTKKDTIKTERKKAKDAEKEAAKAKARAEKDALKAEKKALKEQERAEKKAAKEAKKAGKTEPDTNID